MPVCSMMGNKMSNNKGHKERCKLAVKDQEFLVELQIITKKWNSWDQVIDNFLIILHISINLNRFTYKT